MIKIQYHENGNRFSLELTIEQAKNELRAYGFSRHEVQKMSYSQVQRELQDLYSLCVK